MQETMLSCFFPTTVVFIDDKRNYLQGLVAVLDVDHLVPKLFTNPVAAVEFIQQKSSALRRSFLTPIEEQPSDHVGFDIDIRHFHRKLLNNQRFHELTVVICDYAMPQQNGLNVLRQIKNPDLKTIMLTGEADETLAITAFNTGLIDHFIRKESIHFNETLNNTILSLQQDYIKRTTGLMIDNIVLGKLPAKSALADPVFIEFFKGLVKKHAICEYYLVDEQGSFLLLDQQGNTYFLAIMDAPTLESFAQFAIDEAAPAAIIQALQAKQSIPFFYSDEDLATPPSEWESYLHPAHTLEGARTYYYNLITPREHHQVVAPGLQSYQDFLEEYQPE